MVHYAASPPNSPSLNTYPGTQPEAALVLSPLNIYNDGGRLAWIIGTLGHLSARAQPSHMDAPLTAACGNVSCWLRLLGGSKVFGCEHQSARFSCTRDTFSAMRKIRPCIVSALSDFC